MPDRHPDPPPPPGEHGRPSRRARGRWALPCALAAAVVLASLLAGTGQDPERAGAGPHWAYVPPVRPPLPEVRGRDWPRNAIDAFVLARLERAGLRPSPPADRATLIRRLSLALIGLPPSPEEVDAFVADDRDTAYEELVDRLLASPQFGERWARPWLDLARYADSHGFQTDDLRDLWPYRDWVIASLNADMPFDRFTVEQIAGDLLPDPTEAQKIATGFHRSAPLNVEAGADPEETRIQQVIDRVNTTATVWLGTTLECAQCHAHNYDPFTQRDYYRFFAFFDSTVLEADRSDPKVPGSIEFLGPNMTLADPAREPERERLRARLRELDRQQEERGGLVASDLERWEAAARRELRLGGPPHALDVAEFASSAGASGEVLDDGSVLVGGQVPPRDVYTVTVRTSLTGITGFRLDALTHPSLPEGGPGRADAEHSGFVLSEVAVTARPLAGGPPQEIALGRARSDVPAGGAIDGDLQTGWSIRPRLHRPHCAVFETRAPVGFDQGTLLTFVLVQAHGDGRTIGRFRLSAVTGDRPSHALPEDVAAILELDAASRTQEQRKTLLEYRLGIDDEAVRIAAERAETAAALDRLRPPTTLVMQELPQPRTSAVFVRGDHRRRADEVEPGTPEVLHPLADRPRNRLGLARWLGARDNPLVARVTVNRWWAELFGHGIVATPEDFGSRAAAPTHPRLLDWLAVEFMDGGWSMKKLLKTIVMSATYRQSSVVTPELLARDGENRLYARGPRFRMDAEMVRDNALSAAGLLSLEQGGPPVRPYQPDGLWGKIGGVDAVYTVSEGEDRYRRGVYVVWKRGSPYPSFLAFDATWRLRCTVKRSRSNTPLQALTLLNDPVYVEAAMALARRVLTERPDAGVEERIRHAFRLCVARSPRPAEIRTLQRLLRDQLRAHRSDEEATLALVGGFDRPASVPAAEFAAWYGVATALLNLDETITRG